MERDRSELEKAEKHVADDIEAAIHQPSSIEEEAMLEAAEIEEVESGEAD
ncbi:MAG: hypothetical protein HKN74_05495 [Acidimicrobiia bacterium]|nr:hypothetical protein [Acidimicrobiia bacterium]MBT8216441.1 hypothetical protein [Acidimicrobiia bacterium]NNF09718.1 hypothetical protein [Acidimicrobiia bacterium]NNL71396.1 hypothetical protein [Acidimicrobiia bacterium]